MDAAVVGSGPNGLSAAVALARAGLRVRVHEAQSQMGGGTRSAELTLPGFVHDLCSAIHPLGISSPFFREVQLDRYGLEWIHPGVPVAHPLDDGTAVILSRSLEETATGLGADGADYRRIVAPLADRFDSLLEDVLGPMTHWPKHPLVLARFGMHAALPASRLPFHGVRARALAAGLSAHSFLRLTAPLTASFALIFAASAHRYGWPLPRGGSQRIADALATCLRGHGGEIVTSNPIGSLKQLAASRAVLFDTSPAILDRIAGDRLPAHYRSALRGFRRGPAVFKLDYALAGPVPWRAPECRQAGTVHLGGTFEEVAAAEAEMVRGGHPERPFVLVAQQSLFDPSRAPPGKHTLWAYCHVPNGSTVDMTSRIEAQIERFAPGFRDLILAQTATGPADLEARNANCAGGDISGGAYTGLQFLLRPFPRIDPYATPAKELYLCSSSTPPGSGVHGMCGFHAARSALRRSFGMR